MPRGTVPPTTPCWPPCPTSPSCNAASIVLSRAICRAACVDRRQPLACDLTLTPYHGQPLHDADEVYRSQAKSGTTHFHAYATAYVVKKGQRFTVALVYVRKGQALKDVLQAFCDRRRAGVRPHLLLDRGFCSVEIIRYLQVARHSWLLPLVARGRKADHPRGASGSQVFRVWKRGGFASYTMTNALGKKATFAVCVKCRKRRGERGKHGREALVYAFGGRRQPSCPEAARQTYRSRFGIETSYRQMNQARIRTCTRDPLLRLLYVGVALILRNVWVWLHGEALAHPRRGGRRVDLSQLHFRQMLLWLQHYAETWLGIHEEVAAQLPIWV